MEQCTFVNQSPSILRAPQLARAKRGVPQRRLPAWCWCARIPFRFRPCLSPLSVYFTRVHGHSLTPVPAHACWILRWEALHIVLLQIVLQASSGTKAWHSTMCREKAALTKNGENGCFRRLIEKTKASILTLLPFVQDWHFTEECFKYGE